MPGVLESISSPYAVDGSCSSTDVPRAARKGIAVSVHKCPCSYIPRAHRTRFHVQIPCRSVSSTQDQCGDLPFAARLVPPSTSDSISDSSVLKYTPLNLPSNLTSVLASTFIRSQCSSSAADCKLPICKQTRLALSPGSHTWNTASLIGGIGCACASGVVLAAIFGPTRLRPIENFQNLNRNNPSCRCLVRSLYYFPLVGVKK
jgi:hypothetical protein